MLESNDGRTSVPEVPPDAASCPSSLSVSRKRKVWLNSRAKSGLQDADLAQPRDALVGRGFHQAMLDRETAGAVNDRKDPALLEVQRIALALGRDQFVEQPDRRREGVHGACEMSQVSLLAADQIDQRCLGRCQQLRIAGDSARIVEDCHVHMGHLVRQCHPTAEIREIVGERL